MKHIGAMRLTKLYHADIKVDVETITAFNNEIIQMIFRLKSNSKLIFEGKMQQYLNNRFECLKNKTRKGNIRVSLLESKFCIV